MHSAIITLSDCISVGSLQEFDETLTNSLKVMRLKINRRRRRGGEVVAVGQLQFPKSTRVEWDFAQVLIIISFLSR